MHGEDVRSLRRALKKWCSDETNYQNLLRNNHNPAFESVVDEWLSEHPDIANKIVIVNEEYLPLFNLHHFSILLV